MDKEIPIACSLTDNELRERRKKVLNKIAALLIDSRELPDGFRYRFSIDDSILQNLITVINLERKCCPFLNFKLSLEAGEDFASLDLTGRQGAKETIKELFDWNWFTELAKIEAIDCRLGLSEVYSRVELTLEDKNRGKTKVNPQLLNAEDLGVRLEIAGNLAIWEASPLYKHQKEVDRIRDSIRKNEMEGNSCNCIDAADVYVQFPDGSLKRPDVSIFCQEPSEEEQEEAIKQVPEAVIEVISKKYEAKDLEISPPIYLANGVKDVIVFNPYTNEVVHFRGGEKREIMSPVEIEFECGCRCTV